MATSILLRAAIAAAFVYALTHPSLPQLADSATHAREIGWPIGLVAVPVVLRLARRRGPYPWRVDALLALPFALDSVGNVLDWYHDWASYDTLNHGISWCALGLLVARLSPVQRLPPWARAAVTLGAGAVGAVVWELGEFAAFIHSDYDRGAYPDTLTDLTAGLVGATVAAIVAGLAVSGPCASRSLSPASATRSSPRCRRRR